MIKASISPIISSLTEPHYGAHFKRSMCWISSRLSK